jgi:hypothetical protein
MMQTLKEKCENSKQREHIKMEEEVGERVNVKELEANKWNKDGNVENRWDR